MNLHGSHCDFPPRLHSARGVTLIGYKRLCLQAAVAILPSCVALQEAVSLLIGRLLGF